MSSPIINKKAVHNFFLKDHLEAGIALTGGEVKSVRQGSVQLEEAFVRFSETDVFLTNLYIAPYKFALDPSYDPKRDRRLLLKQQEIDYFKGKLAVGGLTIVPTKMYNTHNLIKVEIALAVPKKKVDKRDALKKKALNREVEKILRDQKLANRDR